METKIQLPEGADKLTLLEGEAAKPINPQKYSENGNLSSVSDYLTHTMIDTQKALITIDPETPSIQLIIDYRTDMPMLVKGSAKVNKFIDRFAINSSKTFGLKEALTLVKMHTFVFVKEEEMSAIKSRLLNFSIKANNNVNVQQQDKAKGFAANIDQLVTWDPITFIMSCPLFSGCEPTTFRVDLCAEVTDGNAKVYFESDELPQLLHEAKEKIIKAEMEKLIQYNIGTITQ